MAVALRRTPESYIATSLYEKGNSKRGHWSVISYAHVVSMWMVIFVCNGLEPNSCWMLWEFKH